MAIQSYAILKQIYRKWNQVVESMRHDNGYQCLDVEMRLNWECNAKCKMCGLNDYIQKNEQSRRENLSLEAVIETIDSLKRRGCRYITFSGGEPTMSKHLLQAVRHASSGGMVVSLNTNGFLLTKERTIELIETGVNIFTFSLDSPYEERHDEIRGLKGCFNRVTQAMDTINEYNMSASSKIKIFVNCVLLKNNIREVEGFTELFSKHRFDYLTLTPASIDTEWDPWTSQKQELRVGVEDVYYFKRDVYPNLLAYNWNIKVEDPFGDDESEIRKNIKSVYSDNVKSCFVPLFHTVVQSNGDVIPCCYSDDSYIMGNVLKEPFEDIWNGDRYKSFRRECRSEKDFPMCLSCRQYKTINILIEERMKNNE